jgi:DHA2 family multidrug resistance protein
VFGRRRFFLICTILFTVSSFLSGIAPNLEFLIVARVFQGIGGGPIIPMSQAIMWEIFPLKQRGLAMSVWGIGIMMGPIFGRRSVGWIADNWSWRWIFYINLPIGLARLLHGERLPVRSVVSEEARARRRGGARPDGAGLRVPAADARPRRALEWFDSG